MSKFFSLFLHKVGENLKRIYSGRNLIWQLVACLITWVIVTTGFDWSYYLSSRDFLNTYRALIFTPILMGQLVPMASPFIIYAYGLARKNLNIQTLGATIGQSALLGWLISTTYKAFTGRIPPRFDPSQIIGDLSHGFQLGLLEGGVFWGWPSSHTTVAFSVAAAVIALYPNSKVVKVLALIYAFSIGLATSVSIHWFSEFAAGAIFGSVIGLVIGKSFRGRLNYVRVE